MPSPKAVWIESSSAKQVQLGGRLRRRKVARADAMHAEIVLLAAERMSNLAITD